MKLYTSRFGEVEIEEGKVITFKTGLPGFPEVKRYIILDHNNNSDIPFKWLQAIDKPDLAFVITDPLLFYPEYDPDIEEEDLRELEVTDRAECGVIVVVTFPQGDPDRMTANLQGPIVINLNTREAKQVILLDERYPLHYPLLSNASR